MCDPHRDAVPAGLRVLLPVFREFGGAARFSGPVATLRCFEDNTLLKAAVDAPGDGRVLVVDGGASLRRALLGGNLAAAAARNGWAGVLIDGCVRDVAELAACNIGIRALSAVPMPPLKRNEGQAGVAVCVQGTWVRPGDWLYADADGVVISDVPLPRARPLSPLFPLPPLSLLPPLP
ncbi:MAG: ribonuclease E activity regulator RraA [Rubrivivax sp.]|nr:ribonuclease E activity regulator RraA [Rubrivivax sp.]